METRYDFGADQGRPIVYVRPVNVADLPEDMREQAMGSETLYALHTADGERLALVTSRGFGDALRAFEAHVRITDRAPALDRRW